MNKLSLIANTADGSDSEEFSIDGRPLSKIIKNIDEGYTGINMYYASDANNYLKSLMLQAKSPSHSGRPILYYLCRACGDIDCGVLTVEIVENEESIVWKNYVIERYSPEFNEEVHFIKPLHSPLEFCKGEYMDLLRPHLRDATSGDLDL